MNLTDHFQKTRDFLERYRPFWYDEILNFYPQTLDAYPQPWIKTLDSLSSQELWELDSKTNYSFLKNTPVFDFIQEAEELSSFLPVINPKTPLSPENLRGMREKKAHEISLLVPYLGELSKSHSFSHIVDLGGGIGHLSRIISNKLSIPCICLDHDKTLAEKGKTLSQNERVTFIAKGLGNPIIPSKDFDILSLEESKEVFCEESLTVGLHSCGPLSLRLMEEAKIRGNSFVNFPCCYLKLDPKSDVNLSLKAQERPLKFSTIGLTLASRSHSKFSFEDFLLKELIKKIRYTFHLLIYEKLNISEFIGAGNYPLKKYQLGFSTYAKLKLDELGIKHSLSEKELDDFFEEKKDLVRYMFLCNILRWQTGRVLELHILLDRALYLEENGFNVELFELFNQDISPRNIGIFGKKKGEVTLPLILS
jgi:hypothetical protein